MKTLVATVINVQDEPDNHYHATATVDAPIIVSRIEFPEGLCADPDASTVSDVGATTYSFGLSGPGKSPYKVGDEIPIRAFEIGEFPTRN
jgi:hypothetical protein